MHHASPCVMLVEWLDSAFSGVLRGKIRNPVEETAL
jgi:hypothetical protein